MSVSASVIMPVLYAYNCTIVPVPATLTRNFTSGTYVKFTYDKAGKDGKGEIWWGGVPPPPPPPAPTIDCGSCGSTLLNDTTFAGDDVEHFQVLPSAAECCAACAKTSKCTQWAWHGVCPDYVLLLPFSFFLLVERCGSSHCLNFFGVFVCIFVMKDRPQRVPLTRCQISYESSRRHRRWRIKSHGTGMRVPEVESKTR